MSFTSIWIRLLAVVLAGFSVTRAADAEDDEYNRAWLHLDGREYAAARAAAIRLIGSHPSYYRAYSLLARAAAIDGTTVATEPALLTASPELREYAIGVWHEQRNQVQLAARSYSACLRAAPHFHPCYLALYHLSCEGRDYSDCAAELPQSAPPALAAVVRASPLLHEHRFDEAQRMLTGVVDAARASDRECELIVALALARAYSGPGNKWRETVAHINRAADLEKTNAVWEDWVRLQYIRAAYASNAGEQEVAGAILAEAEATARARQMKESLIGIVKARAEHALERADPDDAIRGFMEARSLLSSLPRGGGDAWEASFEYGLGRAFRKKGEFDTARFWYSQMRETALRFNNQALVGFALRGLANIADYRGDPFGALEAESQSVRTFRESGYQWQAGAGRGNLCEHFIKLGDYDSASRQCAAAYRSALRFEDMTEVQSLLALRAGLELESGRPGKAVPMLMESLKIGKRTNSPWFEVSAYLGLAQAHRQIGDAEAAIESARAALATAEREKLASEAIKSAVELGNAYLAAGKPAEADLIFDRALDSATRAGIDAYAIQAHRGLAQAALRSDRRQTALQHLEAAVEALESIRHRVLEPEMKARFTERNARIFEELIELLGDLERDQPGQGYGRRSLEIAERSRARAFLDTLVESRADLAQALDLPDRTRHTSLMAALSVAYKDAQRHPSAAHGAEVSRLEAELKEWSRGVRAKNPRYMSLVSPDPLTPDALETLAAREHLTLIEFALGERSSQMWIAGSTGVRTFRLRSRESIENAVRSVRRELSHAPRGTAGFDASVAASSRLYKLLFGSVPVSQLRGRLVIVPDGMLYYLPFEALVVKEQPRGPVYLNDVATISYAPSISVLDELSRDRGRPAPAVQRLLAFGAPKSGAGVSSAASAAVRSSYTGAGFSLAPLPSARLELNVVRDLFAPAAKIVSGAAATEQAFKSEPLGRYNRIHLASHAILDESHPQRSGIVLSEGFANSGEDGILRVNEIVNLKLQADLVVVSACQTALGRIVRGEGVVGLTRALIYAGAKQVSASLWPVNDSSSAEFMKLFYIGLRSGKSAPEAMRDARRSLRSGYGPAYQHPYYWAPFIVIGSH